MIRLGVLASHQGSLLKAVIEACRERRIDGEVVVVISNNSGSGALAHARDAGIATAHLSNATHPDPQALDRAIAATLERHRVDWVLLAGYMKKLGPETLVAHAGRVLNTHPALLPAHGGRGYYGRRVHEAVLATGERETGASVHLVEAEYDSGPVIAQTRVEVRPGDTAARLEERVKAAERQLLIETLATLAEGGTPAAVPMRSGAAGRSRETRG